MTTKGSKMTRRQTVIHESSGNVFQDIGLPDADTHLLKAQIVAELYRLKTDQGLTQRETGRVLGITQPEISRMFKGHFREYSIERLLRFLQAFDQEVEIVSRPRTTRSPATAVPTHVGFRLEGASRPRADI